MALELKGLSRAFGRTRVLHDLSLSVADGEIVVVFGASGTGKSVLLRLIAGIDLPDQGRILIAGRDVSEEPPERRGVGMAFQNFALFPHMTAAQNMASPIRAQRRTKQETEAAVARMAGMLKIDHVLGHYPRELSNGQKQRCALGRALIGGAPVLLLDDPLRNVDAKLRYEMRLELPALLRGYGSSVLYVTQDYREAMALGHRIAVLVDGRIAQVDTPALVYRQPASVAVARLFGDSGINLLATRLVAGSASIAGTTITLGDAAPGDGEARMGVRPEAIALVDSPQPGALPVEVLAQTPLNERLITLVRAADGTELFVSAPIEHTVARRIHQRAYAIVDPAQIHLFRSDDGMRMPTPAPVPAPLGVASP